MPLVQIRRIARAKPERPFETRGNARIRFTRRGLTNLGAARRRLKIRLYSETLLLLCC